MTQDKSLSIEFAHESYWLCKRGTYERSSVLAGESYRQLLTPYATLKAAIEDNPGVPFSDEGAPEPIELSNIAPSWFDESDAGERWGEEY